MRVGARQMRIRIGGDGPKVEALRERAGREGLVLVDDNEAAELIAYDIRSAGIPPPRNPGAPFGLSLNRGDGLRSPPALSPREKEIMEFLADGWSNAEIASVLRIGLRTVRFHLEGIYGKLGVSRRGEAVREALLLGLIRFEV